MGVLGAGRLVAAVGEERRETGIVVSGVYQPVGGAGGRVMPPTFPEGPYLMERRRLGGDVVDTVVVDQVPSQANRVEEALREARDRGRVGLPMFVMRVPTPTGETRLTSFDFPHRYADAYLRDCEVDGARFDESKVGRALRSTTVADVRPLYEREPYSLLFGAWDSHRKGRWPRFARVYASEMFGTEPEVGTRAAGRLDPLNLKGGVDDKAKAEGGWRYLAEGQKAKSTGLSEIGHGNIAPGGAHGGVTVGEVRRRASISFAGLERLRFGDATPEAAQLARAALAALALAGDRLAFGGPSMVLRSGCDLTRYEERVGFELPGGDVEPFEITAAGALELFGQLRDRATEAGVRMATDEVAVVPIPQLAEAIRYSLASAAAESAE